MSDNGAEHAIPAQLDRARTLTVDLLSFLSTTTDAKTTPPAEVLVWRQLLLNQLTMFDALLALTERQNR